MRDPARRSDLAEFRLFRAVKFIAASAVLSRNGAHFFEVDTDLHVACETGADRRSAASSPL
jgi:hypothetical protein